MRRHLACGRLARLGVCAVLLALAGIASGCGWAKHQQFTIYGTVQLQGRGSGQYGGVAVTLDGAQKTLTDTLGQYAFYGYVNGDDTVTLFFTRSGYKSQTVTRSIRYGGALHADGSCDVGLVTLVL